MSMSINPAFLDDGGEVVLGISIRRQGVRDKKTLARIRSLTIPPAWRDRWICCDAQGHIQAIGCDAKEGREQV